MQPVRGVGSQLERLKWDFFPRRAVSRVQIYKPLYAPPSTRIVWPVMNEARSDARNTTVSASSRGSPTRFSGDAADHPRQICSSGSPPLAERMRARFLSRSVAV